VKPRCCEFVANACAAMLCRGALTVAATVIYASTD
jgi:hypothetical protein